MREIKFRGKPIEDYGDVKWFYGNAVLNYDDKLAYIEADRQGYVPVEWESIGQYTGLKDMNGQEIYEGDHLFSKGNMDGIDYVGTVTYCENDAKYILENAHGRLEWIPNNECWVKGNIYEDPELLEAPHASK
ncbi:hypothetical protein BTEQ31S_03746 [Bacillus tequilensis]